jgi:hypothetical protein
MMVQEFEVLYKKYTELETEAEQYAWLKDFTLSLPLSDLLAWNDFIGEKLDRGIDEAIKKGLTEDDKLWFKEQFAKFDALEAIIRPNAEQRKAA